jgi:transposase
MTRPIGTAAELERRRRRAVELLEQGESPTVVARILGVHETSVHRWRRMARRPHGLDARPVPGPTPGLSDYHLRKLERFLRQGAHKHGWPNQLWTAARVARLIRDRFGISYHPEHVRKILKQRLGWTSQKPRRKARERDDKEVERWLGDELPRILREAFRRQAHVAFLDESGFQLTPSVRRTFAPRGQTPVLECWGRRDRISAISCVTLSPLVGRPGLYFELLPVNKTVHGEEVVAFLKELRRQLRGPVTVVWDRSKIHGRSKVVRAWLAAHPEVVVEDLPAYAPTLNPDEWVWGWAKYGRLSNLAAWDAEELWGHVATALIDLKFQPRVLNAFLEEAGVPVGA